MARPSKIRLAKSRWIKKRLARGFFAMRSTQHQLAVARQLRFHLFVHLLIGNAGAAHFILMLYQNLAHFIIQSVLDGQLFHHALAHALRDRFGRLALNLVAFDEPLDHFRGHMADIITNEQHPNVSFYQQLLVISGKSSLLAAPTKCNSPGLFDCAASETFAREWEKFEKQREKSKKPKNLGTGRKWKNGRKWKTNIDASRQCVDAPCSFLYDELQRAV